RDGPANVDRIERHRTAAREPRRCHGNRRHYRNQRREYRPDSAKSRDAGLRHAPIYASGFSRRSGRRAHTSVVYTERSYYRKSPGGHGAAHHDQLTFVGRPPVTAPLLTPFYTGGKNLRGQSVAVVPFARWPRPRRPNSFA